VECPLAGRRADSAADTRRHRGARAAGAGLELKAHPRMQRYACGYALANKGHDTRTILGWLGHRSITSTAVYTTLAPSRFKDFWRDRNRTPARSLFSFACIAIAQDTRQEPREPSQCLGDFAALSARRRFA
jgi:Phage integrase family